MLINGNKNGGPRRYNNKDLKKSMNIDFGNDYDETKHYIAKSGYKNSGSGPKFK